MVDKFLEGESGGKLLLLNSGIKLKARNKVGIFWGKKNMVLWEIFSFENYRTKIHWYFPKRLLANRAHQNVR